MTATKHFVSFGDEDMVVGTEGLMYRFAFRLLFNRTLGRDTKGHSILHSARSQVTSINVNRRSARERVKPARDAENIGRMVYF